jgi:C4-dicarboxylate-specific signal transduction histidine kinase
VKTRVSNPAVPLEGEGRQLLSDLFHQLSQPLTTLCCALELASLRTRTAEQYSQVVIRALAQAEKVSWLATAIRELFDAGNPGENPEALELSGAVEQTVADLLAVAETAGIQIRYQPAREYWVCFDPLRLRQGLFHLLGSLAGCGQPGSIMKIEMSQGRDEVELRLSLLGNGFAESSDLLKTEIEHPPEKLIRRLGMGIARAVFEAGGGSFTAEAGAEAGNVEVKLPAAR